MTAAVVPRKRQTKCNSERATAGITNVSMGMRPYETKTPMDVTNANLMTTSRTMLDSHWGVEKFNSPSPHPQTVPGDHPAKSHSVLRSSAFVIGTPCKSDCLCRVGRTDI